MAILLGVILGCIHELPVSDAGVHLWTDDGTIRLLIWVDGGSIRGFSK